MGGLRRLRSRGLPSHLDSESRRRSQGAPSCFHFARADVTNEIVLDRLFTHRWKLEQAKEAYELFDKQTSGKGVILPS